MCRILARIWQISAISPRENSNFRSAGFEMLEALCIIDSDLELGGMTEIVPAFVADSSPRQPATSLNMDAILKSQV